MKVSAAAIITSFASSELAQKPRMLQSLKNSRKARWRLSKEAFWIAFSLIIIVGTSVASISYFRGLDIVALSAIDTPSPSPSASSTPIPTAAPTNAMVPASPTLVIRSWNNSVMYRTYSASLGWNSWVTLPGQTTDSPAAVFDKNELHMVVRDQNQRLSYGYVDSGGIFSNWTLIEGERARTSSAPTLTMVNATTLCLVIRGLDDNIDYSFYDLTSRNWTSWASFPSGQTIDSPAAVVYDGELHVAVRGIDLNGSSIYHNTLDLSTGNFGEWRPLNAGIRAAPTLTASADLHEVILLILNRDDNRTLRSTWNGTAWNDFIQVEGLATSDGPAAAIVGDRLWVVFRGETGTGLWGENIFLTENFSGSPIDLRYDAASKPTLTG